MVLRWLLATLHLLALGIGLGAIWVRGRALLRASEVPAFRSVFLADTGWGIAFLLWLITGLVRAFGGLEMGTDYYLHNHFFHAKMALLVVILVLEIRPMTTLIRWRIQLARGADPDRSVAPLLARISFLQAVLVVLMLMAATAMARGLGTAGA